MIFTYICEAVSTTEKQHVIGIALLDALGLQYILLKPDSDGGYRYVGWSMPLIDGNGSPKITRRGLIRKQQIR